ncbi:hypothetical protein BDV93DRAFT_517028 [Ceratobasidium sp. AG-I]|nr:hypothetical protein BDV93DRAFT_517028 [Ceratobasidium sp. AG-I]
MSSSPGGSSPAYPSVGTFPSSSDWRSRTRNAPTVGSSNTIRATPTRERARRAGTIQLADKQSTPPVPESPAVESPSSRGVFVSPRPFGSSYLQGPSGARLARPRTSPRGNTRYTSTGVAYTYAPNTIQGSRNAPTSLTPRASVTTTAPIVEAVDQTTTGSRSPSRPSLESRMENMERMFQEFSSRAYSRSGSITGSAQSRDSGTSSQMS